MTINKLFITVADSVAARRTTQGLREPGCRTVAGAGGLIAASTSPATRRPQDCRKQERRSPGARTRDGQTGRPARPGPSEARPKTGPGLLCQRA
jgi:hypothetical protein